MHTRGQTHENRRFLRRRGVQWGRAVRGAKAVSRATNGCAKGRCRGQAARARQGDRHRGPKSGAGRAKAHERVVVTESLSLGGGSEKRGPLDLLKRATAASLRAQSSSPSAVPRGRPSVVLLSCQDAPPPQHLCRFVAPTRVRAAFVQNAIQFASGDFLPRKARQDFPAASLMQSRSAA